MVHEGGPEPGEFRLGGYGKFVDYLNAWEDWWRDWQDRAADHYSRLSGENKFVLDFYFKAVNELSIHSGLLRSFVEDLNMSLEERMRFVRKLNMIHITLHNIQYQKQADNRQRGYRHE